MLSEWKKRYERNNHCRWKLCTQFVTHLWSNDFLEYTDQDCCIARVIYIQIWRKNFFQVRRHCDACLVAFFNLSQWMISNWMWCLVYWTKRGTEWPLELILRRTTLCTSVGEVARAHTKIRGAKQDWWDLLHCSGSYLGFYLKYGRYRHHLMLNAHNQEAKCGSYPPWSRHRF